MLSMSFDFSETNTSRPGSLNGGGRSSTALITLKTAVLAPMPSASVSTATAVKPGFFSSWRKANLRSFITQRLHRIDFCSATGGHVTGSQCYEQKNRNHAKKRERVRWSDFIKLISEQSSERECARDTDGQANQCREHSLPDDEGQNPPQAGTQCDA